MPDLDHALEQTSSSANERAALLAHRAAALAALAQPDAAIVAYNDALAALDQTNDSAARAVVAWQLGTLLLQRGEHSTALELMQQRVDYERNQRLPTVEYYERKLEDARHNARAARSVAAAPRKASWLDRLLRR